MHQRASWIESFETVDGDYVDLPNEADYDVSAPDYWPADMGWDVDAEVGI